MMNDINSAEHIQYRDDLSPKYNKTLSKKKGNDLSTVNCNEITVPINNI